MTTQQTIPVPHKGWLPLVLIILLTSTIFIVSVISLVSGWLTIFQNLFYFPIILACVYYIKRGFVFSVLLACGYFILMLIFSQDPGVLEGALIRVLIFILVAGVITYLSIVRIRAEDALKESEEFNRGLVENMPNLVVVYDYDRKIRYVNPAATMLLGYSVEEMEGTDIMTYVNPPQHAEIAAATKERFSSDTGKSLEIDLITKAGQHLTVISKGAPLNFRNKPAVLVLLADITDRKRAEETLQHLTEFQESVITNARVWLSVLNLTGTILMWNTAAEEISGYRSEEVVNKNEIWKMLYPDKVYRKQITDIITRIISQKKYLENFETTIRSKQGNEKVISWNTKGIPDAVGRISNYIVIGVDVTDRQLAKEALLETNAYLNNLFNYANAPIITWDFGFHITRFNHAFEDLTGRSEEEVLGKPLDLLFPDDSRTASMTLIQKAFTGERWETVEIPILTKDGTIRTVIWNSANILDPRGRTISTIAQGNDITERKQAEAALRQANKQLNLLSSITRHDILNQLMALKWYLYLSNTMIDNPTKLAGYIQKEEQAANAIERQITFTKDYEELGVAAPEWQNVNASIKTAVASLPMRDVRVEVDPKNPAIFADRLFEKVFYNLIDNALRYGGADMKTIRVSSQEIDTGLKIVCEDDGVGISDEDKKKLFTRGFGKNTGLGLFLSQEILAITGITIIENGTPGKGARFEITVPKGGWRTKGDGA